jgi:hypothetical protein
VLGVTDWSLGSSAVGVAAVRTERLLIVDDDAAAELTMRDYYEFICAAKPAAPKS